MEGLDKLHQSLFGDVLSETIIQKSMSDGLSIVSYLDNEVVGYKLGFDVADADGVFYSWAGGVAKNYRGQGLAQYMAQWQYEHLFNAGYQKIQTKCRYDREAMIALNLKNGFKIVKEYQGRSGTKKFLMEKSLEKI